MVNNMTQKYLLDSIEKTADRKRIANVNNAAKTIYNAYRYIDGIITPAAPDAIKCPELFGKSIFIHKDFTPFDWLNNALINPVALTKTLNKRVYELRDEDNKRISADNNGDEITYGFTLEDVERGDMEHYAGFKVYSEFNPNEYTEEWCMPKDLIDDIADKLGDDVTILSIDLFLIYKIYRCSWCCCR
jgi:hypothetical protein